MSKSSASAVRIGPITIFTLLIILCLATLSVLALVTSRASYASAQKQSAGVQDTYDVERQGQGFTAQMDGRLSESKAAGQDRSAAIDALRRDFGSQIDISGNTITTTFDSGTRELTVQIEITNDLTYQITEWTVATNSNTDENVNLWSGSGNTAQR